MEEVTISYYGFAAVCLVWFAVGVFTGLWICFKRDLEKNDETDGSSI